MYRANEFAVREVGMWATLAVQALHVVLQSPPLLADAVGELLAGLFARLLQALPARLTRVLLRVRAQLRPKTQPIRLS